MNEQIFTQRPLFPAELDMAHPLTKGLIGCWVMNDIGSLAYDSSPYHNHGRATGSIGKFEGRNFDGVSQFLDCGNKDILLLKKGAATFTIWLVTTDASAQIDIIAKAGETNWYLFRLVNGLTYAQLYDGTFQIREYSTHTVNDGKLHCISTTLDGATPIAHAYIDNIPEPATGLYETVTSVAPTDSLKIAKGDTSGGFLSAKILLTALHNRAISDKERTLFYLKPYDMFIR